MQRYETRVMKAEVVFTLATAAPTEEEIMKVVLKILTNQITTTFFYKTACFCDALVFVLEKVKY